MRHGATTVISSPSDDLISRTLTDHPHLLFGRIEIAIIQIAPEALHDFSQTGHAPGSADLQLLSHSIIDHDVEYLRQLSRRGYKSFDSIERRAVGIDI